MISYYFDSSALVKYYVQETGSAWVTSLIDAQPAVEVITALVTGPEIIAALTRRVRTGLTTPSDAAFAINAFRYHFQSFYKPVYVTTSIIQQAMNLAEKYGLRGYDSIQLACALMTDTRFASAGVGPLTFISADRELNQSAQAERLTVDDPNNH